MQKKKGSSQKVSGDKKNKAGKKNKIEQLKATQEKNEKSFKEFYKTIEQKEFLKKLKNKK
jgi:hypothetical protein